MKKKRAIESTNPRSTTKRPTRKEVDSCSSWWWFSTQENKWILVSIANVRSIRKLMISAGGINMGSVEGSDSRDLWSPCLPPQTAAMREAVGEEAEKATRKVTKIAGKATDSNVVEELRDRACREWDPHDPDLFVVVSDDALDEDNSAEVVGFKGKAKAIAYARAMSNGNVDHHILHVTGRVDVVSTMFAKTRRTKKRRAS